MGSWKRNVVGPTFKYLACGLFGLCLLVVVFAALHPASIAGDDSVNHLNWITEFAKIRDAGVFYPRWISNTFAGLGAPVFYFYPPLPYFIASIIHSLLPGLGPTQLFHCLLLLGTIGSGLTLALYLRSRHVRWGLTALAACVYAFFPYRFTDAYVRNALGEHIAFIWIPLVWLALDRLVSKNRSAPHCDTLLLAIAASALLLTNLPSFIVTCLVGFAYLLAQRSQLDRLFVTRLIVAALVAALVSAWYWMPAVYFSPLLNKSQLDIFKPADNPWQFYLQSIYLTLLTGKPHELLKNLVPGLVLLSLLAATIIERVRRSAIGYDSRPLSVAAGLCIFFQLPILSTILWDHLPGLSFVQMSWRWNVIGLFIVSSSFAHTRSSQKSQARGWQVLLTVLAIFSAMFYLPFGLSTYREHAIVNTVEPYRIGAPEYLPAGGTLTYKGAIDFAKSHQEAPPALLDHTSYGALQETHGTPRSRAFITSISQSDSATIQQFAWPQWHAFIDSTRTETIADSIGRVRLNLPAGVHHVELRLVESPAEVWGARLSCAGCFLVLLLGAMEGVKRRRPGRED